MLGRQLRIRSRSLNPAWFVRNVATSWRHRADFTDFIQRLLFLYSAKLPRAMRKPDWTICFRYPDPIGDIRLLLRANGGADAFTHSEVFEHHYYRLPLARPPSTILDLGANIGLTAIFFSRTYPEARLACVEAVADNLRILTENLKLNGVEAAIIAAAIDVKDGTAVMERHVRDYGHRIAINPSNASPAYFEVPAISVPSTLRHLGWDRIGLLKIDIEGHEQRLLSEDCEWLDRVDAICLEYHHDFGEVELARMADRFGFLPAQRLHGGIWFMTRRPKQ